MATAKAVRTRTFMEGHEAPLHKCPKQTGDCYKSVENRVNTCVQVVSFSEARAAIQTIRYQVFQQEQNVEPDLDFDGLDDITPHLIAQFQDQPVGTVRIRSLDLCTVKLERMAVLSAYRGQGIGKALVQAAIAFAKAQDISEIHLNAQVHAKEFYKKLGFEPCGEEFDEAGIAHVAMKKVN